MPCVLWRNLAIRLEQALFAHETHGRGIELGFIDCVDDSLQRSPTHNHRASAAPDFAQVLARAVDSLEYAQSSRA